MAAKSIWDELNFEEILSSCGMTQNAISVTMSLIIGRLVGTRSELENHSWFQNQTALIEMTPSNIEGIGKDIFYTTGDVLYENKDKIESAFRDLKSELGTSPIYHSNEKRTKAHLFIGMLACHLLVAIEYRLSSNRDKRSWNTVRKILSTHQRATVSMMNKRGENIRIRISTTPEPPQLERYIKLFVFQIRLKK